MFSIIYLMRDPLRRYMRYIKKILFMICCFGLFSNISRAASVENFRYGNLLDGTYFTSEKIGTIDRFQVQFINSSNNNNFAYPLDYGVKLDSTRTYNEKNNNQAALLNISEEDWERVQALAYFGYMYPGHEDNLWYAVTWQAINKIVNSNTRMYITNTLTGYKIPRTTDMLNELDKLVDDYININIPPAIDLNYGETKAVNVDGLSNYKVTSLSENVNLHVNTLNVIGNNPGGEWIELERNGENNSIYEASNGKSTKLMFRSNMPKLKKKIQVKVISGFLDIDFKIPENKYYSNCSSDDKTIYGLYTENDVLKDTYELRDLSQFQTGYLPYGNYYIKQLKNACNVKKDPNLYDFKISKYFTTKTINLKENYKYIKIKKKACNSFKCSNETNAKFIISDGIKEFTVKTNQLGNAYINMGMGKYNIKQIEGMDNYDFSEEMKIDLNDFEEDEVNIDLTSISKKGNIAVNVLDDNNLGIRDAKVCLYSGTKTLKCDISNKDGIINFNDIDYGEYTIKVIEIGDDYNINKTKFKVSLFNNKIDDINIINKINYTQEEIKTDKKDNVKTKSNNISDNDYNDEMSIDDVPETSVSNYNGVLFITFIALGVLTLIKIKQH